MRKFHALYLLIMLCALGLALGIGISCDQGDDDDDDDDDDSADDDDSGDDDTADDDTDDDDDEAPGCLPIEDPYPPQDQIYIFQDDFVPTTDYVAVYGSDLVIMSNAVNSNFTMDSFEIHVPKDAVPGEYDLRWDSDPNESDVMALFIDDYSGLTYTKAFFAYRGCISIEQTGGIGDNFRATLTDLYMTEAVVNISTGSVQIMMPGDGMQAFFLNLTTECAIVEFNQSTIQQDMCMHL